MCLFKSSWVADTLKRVHYTSTSEVCSITDFYLSLPQGGKGWGVSFKAQSRMANKAGMG